MIVGIIFLVSYIICGIFGQLLFLLNSYEDFPEIDKDSFGFSLWMFCCGWFGFVCMLLIIIGQKLYKIISNWNWFDGFLEKLESFIKKLLRSR
jgi:hypothetical protein